MRRSLIWWVLATSTFSLVAACSKTDSAVTPTTSSTTSATATVGVSTTTTSVSTTSTTATSTTVVKIPDPTFEQALIDLGVDSDKTLNGQVSATDAQKVTSINIAFKGITDLTGIEGFTNLTALMCGYNKLTTLNVSQNKALIKLVCHYNSLTGKLDLKALTALTSLDATGNPALTTICVADPTTAAASMNYQKDATATYSTCP